MLSSIFHIDNPTGNISLPEVKKIVDDPLIQSAIPVSFGDNYKNYRIVGTSKIFQCIFCTVEIWKDMESEPRGNNWFIGSTENKIENWR